MWLLLTVNMLSHSTKTAPQTASQRLQGAAHVAMAAWRDPAVHYASGKSPRACIATLPLYKHLYALTSS